MAALLHSLPEPVLVAMALAGLFPSLLDAATLPGMAALLPLLQERGDRVRAAAQAVYLL